MNTDPGWDLYRSFAAVLRAGSLSGAARMLGMTQPSIARHVDALEDALGIDLFVRTQRGLSPTDAALRLRPYAESLEATAAALRRAVASDTDATAGTVRITASEIVGTEHLPAILTRVRQRHPALHVELVLSNAVDDLLQRHADIAVRMVEPVQQALVVRRAGAVEVGLHAHGRYLADREIPRSLAALSAHNLIGFDTETPMIRAVGARFPELNRAAFALRADSDIAQLAAIRAGFGIGFCQVQVARRDPDLVRVLAGEVSFEFGMWIVMHEDLRSNQACRIIFDALAEGLSTIGAR
ncbi:LysR family transcriptional regulator [Sphingomonas koreensis]|jgi:DNA-binding transcriptional LysR family regulator|uniref:LysR family transcriptional regulator n=1 Tax=Sphingomonas koreensis TaxID=93064 RepID=A0A1L6JE25_9SPHN|nr:LysR family transcriptional regulator [Sphingomonas koreensis]APR54169.1 LysR family transcriptional regulator [Sphingomonas koreensis]MDC7809160.1 LysR family transcriptional regulator [Sphingomonas koreensis]RSU18806.1 LysR family transcriptional regulator [Sphingomonas koreensis]RSU25583.1 LysR family transcriptional regulator [Sphingomonas koreensis]RSU25683.1 LysR family transcriptional regulator [Sphingomonas koreensis]